MGAATVVNGRPPAWVLWTGILAGPIAWALDLLVSYAVVKWTCLTSRHWPLDASTVVALAIAGAGAALAWRALQQTMYADPTDGGAPPQRAKFMAILGVTTSALFAITIAAAWIPRWVLDACH